MAALLGAGAAGCAAPPGAYERYAALEDWYLQNGFLRLDTDPADAPLDRETLARNFEIVAFNTEFADGEELVEALTPSTLTRWSGEVTWRLLGAAATAADAEELAALTARLSAATGLTLREAQEDETPRMLILVLGPRDRAALARGGENGPATPAPLIEAWAEDDRFPCVGILLEKRRTGPEEGRRGAMVLIKAETRGRLRRACLHEEVTQSLGLTNDGPGVRPSIFNDDQEFALLTRHDELLLRVLYDPRLSVGMTAEEGMPIVRRILADMDIEAARDASADF